MFRFQLQIALQIVFQGVKRGSGQTIDQIQGEIGIAKILQPADLLSDLSRAMPAGKPDQFLIQHGLQTHGEPVHVCAGKRFQIGGSDLQGIDFEADLGLKAVAEFCQKLLDLKSRQQGGCAPSKIDGVSVFQLFPVLPAEADLIVQHADIALQFRYRIGLAEEAAVIAAREAKRNVKIDC